MTTFTLFFPGLAHYPASSRHTAASCMGWRIMVRLALQEPSPRTRPANLWELKTVFCDPQNCIFPKKPVFYNKMRTAMQIKKKTSQHTVRGAARCKVALFLHTTSNQSKISSQTRLWLHHDVLTFTAV